MDFLTQQEISGFKQDIKHGDAKQIAEKTEFERKLLNGLGDDMKDAIEHPDNDKKSVKTAKKYMKKKKLAIWKENFKKIFKIN